MWQRVDDLRTVLHLIKNNKGLFRYNLLTTCQHQILQNTINIFGSLEELFVFLIFIKVKICNIFIVTFTELFQNPSLAYLTHTFQDQGLAIGGILPVQQLFQNKSLHRLALHTFIRILVFLNHIFIIYESLKKYKPNHKTSKVEVWDIYRLQLPGKGTLHVAARASLRY